MSVSCHKCFSYHSISCEYVFCVCPTRNDSCLKHKTTPFNVSIIAFVFITVIKRISIIIIVAISIIIISSCRSTNDSYGDGNDDGDDDDNNDIIEMMNIDDINIDHNDSYGRVKVTKSDTNQFTACAQTVMTMLSEQNAQSHNSSNRGFSPTV